MFIVDEVTVISKGVVERNYICFPVFYFFMLYQGDYYVCVGKTVGVIEIPWYLDQNIHNYLWL